MFKALAATGIGLLALAAVVLQPQPALATFHCMRIHAVMAGFNGNNNIQYVELRMTSAGQNVVSGHTLKFYDSTGPSGTLKATFTFPSDAANGLSGDSILVATSEYNANNVGPGGGANGGDPLHPIQFANGGGKVSFAEEGPITCSTAPPPVDSVAYGNYPTADIDYCSMPCLAAPALPSPSDNRALRLQDATPPLAPFDNNVEYLLTATATTPKTVMTGMLPSDLDTPRNNAREVAKIAIDSDTDGVFDDTDNCPSAANAFQGNLDLDGLGDACDPDIDGDATMNASDADDDNDGVTDAAEGQCGNDTNDDGTSAVNDGCPQVGAAAESGGQCSNARDDDSDGFVNDGCPGASETNACGANNLSPNRRPERRDAGFLGDDDGDGLLNEALPAGAASLDCDGDGYTGSGEANMYSQSSPDHDQDPCGDGTGAGLDGSNNGWGSDLDGNGSLGGGDLNSFLFPLRGDMSFNKFGHMASEGANTRRWDLDGDGAVGGGDLNALNPAVTAPSARPPMLDGNVAFG